ncbi:MAG: DMT family transporter [Bdellovibrionota bacterium]
MDRARLVGVTELILAAALWGFGFVAATWALEGMGPLAITGWRFVIALLVGGAIVLVRKDMRRSLNMPSFLAAAAPGLFISLSLITQTWGLEYTTATKSGFITILYVLIVPFLERLWLGRNVPRFHVVYVLGALIGVALICDLPSVFFGGESQAERDKLNFGDALTLLCSVFAALQIIWYGFIQDRIGSSFVFNLYQSFWAGVLPLIASFFFEPLPTFPKPTTIVGLLMLALGSTLIAFALQIRAQKKISPSLASLLFLLESPFAGFFAILFLNERLTTMTATGAAIILLSLASSVVFQRESSATK